MMRNLLIKVVVTFSMIAFCWFGVMKIFSALGDSFQERAKQTEAHNKVMMAKAHREAEEKEKALKK